MVQVIDRVGALLRAFSDTEPELALGICAERSGLSKSSAHRLLVSMAEIGLVEQLENSNWRLGGFVVQLAAVRLAHLDIRAEVVAELRAFGQRFGAATAFSVPNGSEMVYVERTDSPRPFAPSARLGSTAPVWAGAAGRAVLAALSPEERKQRLRGPDWSALPKKVRDSVLKDLAEAVDLGYSIDHGQFFDGIAGVAVALGRPHEPVAALSLILPPDRMDAALTEEMGQALRALADRATTTSYAVNPR